MIIYRITNKINGKSYVGMEASYTHAYFGSGVVIRAAIKKYGKENFFKEVLESNFDSYETLAKAEIKHIAAEKVSNPNGIYNLNDGGLGCSSNKGKSSHEIYGHERSVEISGKISKSLKDKKIQPPSRLGSKGSEKQKIAARKTCVERKKSKLEIQKIIDRTIKSIICMETGQIFKSCKEASIELHISRGNLSSVLTGKRKSAGGFTFKYWKGE